MNTIFCVVYCWFCFQTWLLLYTRFSRFAREGQNFCVSKHASFYTAKTCVFCRVPHLTSSGLLQTDLFQGRCCLAEFFKHKYCHASHTSFAFFFHLPSYIGKGHKHSRKRKLRQPMYGNLGSPIYPSWRNKRKRGTIDC